MLIMGISDMLKEYHNGQGPQSEFQINILDKYRRLQCHSAFDLP